MKEFNLELSKQGHPVCTRDGRPARIICWDKKYKIPNAYCILALIDYNDDEIISSYTNEGRACIGEETTSDLMMVSEKHEGWVNIYRNQSGEVTTGVTILNSKKEVEYIGRQSKNYVATAKIEWEE